jgi:thioredoxin 1
MLLKDALHPTASELRTLIAATSLPVIVEVGADGCFPCQKLQPFLRKFATELDETATVVAIDTDGNKELAREWRIDFVPQILLFRDGELKERIQGFDGYEAVRAAIGSFLGGGGPERLSSAEIAFVEAVAGAEAALETATAESSSKIIGAIWEPLAPIFENFAETQKAVLDAGQISQKEYNALIKQEQLRLLEPFRPQLDVAYEMQNAAIKPYAASIDKAVEAFACSHTESVATEVGGARFCLPGDPMCRIA